MNQWAHFERAQNVATKAKLNKEIYQCKCGCTWFEQIRTNQFVSEQHIIPGQNVPPLNGEDIFLLRCVRCGSMTEPKVMLNNPTSGAEKKYLEAIADITEPMAEDVVKKDAVQDTK